MVPVIICFILAAALTVGANADLQGGPAEITVSVIGCQQHPLDSARVLLLGDSEAENLGAGEYRFAEVYPGEYELFVYTPYSDSYREKLIVGQSFSRTQLNVMLCTCVECINRVEVRVVGPNGKEIKNARVSVPALFIGAATDKKGRTVLEVPAGEWEFAASADGLSGSATAPVPFVDPGAEPEPTKLTISIE